MLRKKWLSFLVAVSMVAAMLPTTAFAEADAVPAGSTPTVVETATGENKPQNTEGEKSEVETSEEEKSEGDKSEVETSEEEKSEGDKSEGEVSEEATGETETPADETEEKTEDVEKPASEEADPDEETVVVPPVTTPEVTENQTANNGIATMAETRTEYPFETGGTGYATLADAVKAVSKGGTITLKQNLDGAPGVSVPSGKEFTLDFGGHTYTLKNPGAGSTGTETNGFQLLRDSTITFRNGTIRISEENGIGEGNPH